jgi:hypothetical protein
MPWNGSGSTFSVRALGNVPGRRRGLNTRSV